MAGHGALSGATLSCAFTWGNNSCGKRKKNFGLAPSDLQESCFQPFAPGNVQLQWARKVASEDVKVEVVKQHKNTGTADTFNYASRMVPVSNENLAISTIEAYWIRTQPWTSCLVTIPGFLDKHCSMLGSDYSRCMSFTNESAEGNNGLSAQQVSRLLQDLGYRDFPKWIETLSTLPGY